MNPPGHAWPDERIEELSKRLDLLGTAAMMTARHDVRLDNHDKVLMSMEASLVRIEAKLDDQIADRSWSPKVLAIVLGPLSASLLTVVGLVVMKGA